MDTMTLLTGVYAEVLNGLSSEDSRFAGEDGFAEAWAEASADVAATKAKPGFVGFDLPGEYGSGETE